MLLPEWVMASPSLAFSSCLVLRHELLPIILQRRFQSPAGPRQQRLHGLVRYSKHTADLDLAHTLVVEEGDRQPLPLRQRLQRRIDTRAKLTLDQMAHLACRLGLLRY